MTTNVEVSDGVEVGAGEGDGAAVADGHGEWNGSVGADGSTEGAGEQLAARTTTIAAATADWRNAPDVEVEAPGRDPVIIVP